MRRLAALDSPEVDQKIRSGNMRNGKNTRNLLNVLNIAENIVNSRRGDPTLFEKILVEEIRELVMESAGEFVKGGRK